MLLSLIGVAVAAPLRFPCGTVAHMPAAPFVLANDPPAPPGKGTLAVRDSFGTDYGGIAESEHFAMKWGANLTPTSDEIDGTLASLEEAWALAIEDMQFDRPGFTNAYKVNVYYGNSGGDAPDIPYGGAYTDLDDEGYAYIVGHPDLVDLYNRSGGFEASGYFAHEFHHVVQYGEDAYVYADQGAWYWEATADWFATICVPETTWDAHGGAQFRMMPHLPLAYFDYYDKGWSGWHQYAASVFLDAITEWAGGDPTTIRDSWTNASPGADPIDVLDGLLPDGMPPTYTEFARALTQYDFAFGDLLEAYYENYAESYPADNHSIVAEADPAGSDRPVFVYEALLPGAYAYNVVRMVRPEPHAILVTFTGDATGSRDTASSFDVWVLPSGGAATLVTLADNAGTFTVDGADALDDLTVVVVSHPGTHKNDETFGYALALADAHPPVEDTGFPDGPDDGSAEPKGGCGCGSTGGPAAGWLSILALALSRRRRS